MAAIRTRKEPGRLTIDFCWVEEGCRIQRKLREHASNARKLEKMQPQFESEMKLGRFADVRLFLELKSAERPMFTASRYNTGGRVRKMATENGSSFERQILANLNKHSMGARA